MAHFVREFSSLPTAALRALLDGCAQPWEESALYEVAGDRRLVDTSLRLSRFRAIADDARLFAAARALVAAAAAPDALNDYTLLQNDVTHIRYEPGGFFKAHEDYLSLTSNVVEEYTMLVCVTPDAEAAATVGGETRITLPTGHHATAAATTAAFAGSSDSGISALSSLSCGAVPPTSSMPMALVAEAMMTAV